MHNRVGLSVLLITKSVSKLRAMGMTMDVDDGTFNYPFIVI